MRLNNASRRQYHRRIPALNTTATADMSFILLIFFLLTSSMDSEKGLQQNLPPKETKKEIETKNIDRENVFSIYITEQNTYTLNDTLRSIKDIENRLSAFITQKSSEHVIEILANRESSYQTYFRLQNLIAKTYSKLRDAEARKRYKIPYSICNDEQQEKIQTAIPQRVSEEFVNTENKTPNM